MNSLQAHPHHGRAAAGARQATARKPVAVVLCPSGPSCSGRAPESATAPTSLRTCSRHLVLAEVSKRGTVRSSLVAVLKDEIKYERESYRRDELILSGPPNDFELQDVQGCSGFLLAKEFGDEQVVVRVSLDAQADFGPDEGEDDEDEYDSDEDTDSLPVEFEVRSVCEAQPFHGVPRTG
jgi:complement component 1 Q subcomponent-binding protein